MRTFILRSAWLKSRSQYRIFWLVPFAVFFSLSRLMPELFSKWSPSQSLTNSPFICMRLQSLPLPCKYMFTSLNFVVNNPEIFQTNSAVHSVTTRNRYHLHRPTANFSCFQKKKSAYYSGVKIFNGLPWNLRILMTKKAQFKVALKRYLNTQSFYTVEKFLTFKNDS
jgi:hypothetical protein